MARIPKFSEIPDESDDNSDPWCNNSAPVNEDKPKPITVEVDDE